MLVNFTNHKYEAWSDEQKSAAQKWGEVIDLPFPNVKPQASKADVEKMAQSFSGKIISMKPCATTAQGEMTLCFAVVNRLKAAEISVFAATSERTIIEKTDEDGNSVRTSVFKFVQFREY